MQGTSYHSILGLWSLLTQSIIHSSCLCTRVQLCSANSDSNHTVKVHSRIWWPLAIAHIPTRVVNSIPGTVLTMPPSPPPVIHIVTPKPSFQTLTRLPYPRQPTLVEVLPTCLAGPSYNASFGDVGSNFVQQPRMTHACVWYPSVGTMYVCGTRAFAY